MPMRLPIQRVRMGRHSYRGDVVTYDPRAPIDAEPRPIEMAVAPTTRSTPRVTATKTKPATKGKK